MIVLEAQIFGDKEFVQSLYGFPRALRRRMIEGIGAAARSYAQAVQSGELSGQVLQRRTGKLQKSMVIKEKETPDLVEAQIYPKAKYGWMLGQGTPKNEVLVRAHPRFLAGAGNVAVMSRVVRKIGRGRSKTTTIVRKAQFGESSVVVKAHTRRMILAKVARPFMGPAYERMRPFIEQRLQYAVLQAQQDMMEGLNIDESRGRS